MRAKLQNWDALFRVSNLLYAEVSTAVGENENEQ